MKIVKASFKILTDIKAQSILCAIEAAGRTCYKSESLITPETSTAFVKNIITRGHDSVLEHQSVAVRIICDRGVTHEIVRHRIASYSQESTRYCNYEKKGIVFIAPCFLPDCPIGEITPQIAIDIVNGDVSNRTFLWLQAMKDSELAYNELILDGMQPQEARSVLPNSLKTEIVVTMNLREWRHFFKLRAAGTAGKPHPQMLEITIPMLEEFKKQIPIVFDDIIVKEI